MDYGKLAYLKVEDMEQQIGNINKKQKGFNGARGVFAINRTVNGEIVLTDIAGGGSVCLIMRIKTSSEIKNYLDILIGGKGIYRQVVLPEVSEGTKECLILLQAKLTGTEQLSLKANGVFVGEVELLIIGGETGNTKRRISGDAAEGKAVVLLSGNDLITLFDGDEALLDFSDGKREAACLAADACYYNGHFYVVLLDFCGNIWLRDLNDRDGYRFVGAGCENNVALFGGEGGLYIASIKNGRIVDFVLDSIEVAAASEDVDIDMTAQDLCFVKGGNKAILAIKNKNGASFVMAEKQESMRETIKISARVSWG